MTQYNNTLTEQIGLDDINIYEVTILVTDTLGINDSSIEQAIYGLLETMGMGEVVDTLIKGNLAVSDNIGLNDAFKFLIELVASDTLGLQEGNTAYKSNVVALLDTLVLADITDTRLTAENLLSSIVGLVEYLEKGLSVEILDKLGLTEDIITALRFAGLSVDTLGIKEDLAYGISIYLEADETLAIEDSFLFGQKVQNLIEEGFIFTTTILGPGTAIYTGWVMNSENMAVSTYNNYEFTDMARINGKYYGVKSDGLFLLDGSLDDGVFVESIIRSAKLALGTSNLKALTQAYLGFRADGSPILKMITDEKEETWYTVSESRIDLHTRRIRLAKGQVGRYWQFEIVTTDSTKLELDSVELFPITFKRKV